MSAEKPEAAPDAGDLDERINSAVKRITSGQGLMRVPVDQTDPDIVLRDCQATIAALRNKLNADSQNFQIECQKAEIETLRRKVEELKQDIARHIDSLAAAEEESDINFQRAEAADRELAATREDAERYRWLREGCKDKDSASKANRIATELYGFEWDNAIDAAIKAASKV